MIEIDPDCFMIEFDVDINNHDYFDGVHDDYNYKVHFINGKFKKTKKRPFHITR